MPTLESFSAYILHIVVNEYVTLSLSVPRIEDEHTIHVPVCKHCRFSGLNEDDFKLVPEHWNPS
jgi:hypothetical protein